MTAPQERFARICWVVVAYTVFVILFGAIVRITGSGAGCGQHWPTCHGELLHLPASVETLIELTHRLTSGLSLLAVILLVLLARRRYDAGHPARRGAYLSLLFMVTEALLGASLVLARLVGANDSIPRSAMMALHLVNTSLLTGAMVYLAWAAARRAPRLDLSRSGVLACLGLLAALLAVSMTGAVTALGDTLYPVAPGAGLSDPNEYNTSGAQFLSQARSVHPFLAVFVALLVLQVTLAGGREADGSLWPDRRRVAALVLIQVVAGVVNILLSAPAWMQVLHLAIATFLWISLAWLTLRRAETPLTSPL